MEYGRPKDCADRAVRELVVYNLLDRLDIPYIRVDRVPIKAMEVCMDIDTMLNYHVYKSLFFHSRQQSVFYLLMMPGDKPFKAKGLPVQAGSARLNSTPPGKVIGYLGLHPGSMSITGLINGSEHGAQLLVG